MLFNLFHCSTTTLERVELDDIVIFPMIFILSVRKGFENNPLHHCFISIKKE